MNAAIEITHVGRTVSFGVEKGTGTFHLFLSDTPTDEWRKIFDQIHAKDHCRPDQEGRAQGD
jgi:hypothetical protein